MRLLTMIVLAASQCAFSGCREAEHRSTAPLEEPARVHVHVMDSGPVARTYRTIGEIHSDESATISSPLTGRILKREVAVGDRVNAGDVLFRIDIEELERERSVLTARLYESESLAAEAESRIEEAHAKVESLNADLEYAEFNEKRIKQLGEQFLAAETEVRRVLSVRRALASRLKQAEASVAVASQTLRARKATVAVVESQLRELEGRITDAIVRAPFNCTIVATIKDTGDWVTRTPSVDVLTVASNRYRLLMFTVPDRYYHGVKDVKTVRAQLPDGNSVDAKVLAVSNVLMSDSRGCLLRTLMPQENNDLPVGAILTIGIEVDRRPDALRVINSSLRRIENRTLVYKIDSKGRVTVTPVSIEFEGDKYSAVTGALAVGDRIAIGNLEELGDGVHVEVLP